MTGEAVSHLSVVTEPSTVHCAADEGCITCGDVAVPVRVLGPAQDGGLSLCANAEGATEEIDTSLVGDVAVGDELLAHAGVAIARLDAREEAIG